MSKRNIERVRIPFYNSGSSKTPALIHYNASTPIVNKADDYTVVTESFAVDLSDAALDPAPDYKIAIWCDLKEDTVPATPAGMVYGYNYYTFPGKLYTVDQLVDWFYEILHKKALPFDLGVIDLDGEDLFSLTITNAVYTGSYQPGHFEVYFNEPLSQILTELWSGDPVETAGELYFKMNTSAPGTSKQEYSKLTLVNKIESILVFTTLPVSKTMISDVATNTTRRETILSTVELNATNYDLRVKTDWRYIPTTLRHATITSGDVIQDFDVSVMIQYVSGKRDHHVLRPRERFSINLAFYPRGESF